MQLRPQDVLVMIKLALEREPKQTNLALARSLFLSPAEVHYALRRCKQARLYDEHLKRPILTSLCEFLIHGVKYAFPASVGASTRGILTAGAHPVFEGFAISELDALYVWPLADGVHRGPAVSPLYRSAPDAAQNDERLYQALALLDAIRIGRVREVNFAREKLTEMLGCNE